MRLLLVSSSTVHGGGYLDHAIEHIERITQPAAKLLFVPFALQDHQGYFEIVKQRLKDTHLDVVSLHSFDDPIDAIQKSDAFFVGGGNTMVLLHELYRRRLLEALRSRVLSGVPYVGSSAGANIAGVTIKTTNDMPIVQPPLLHALELVPFNLNPHFLDPDTASTFKGETREERIRQFHQYNDSPVFGLREPAMIEVHDRKMRVLGAAGARLFRPGREPVEISPQEDFTSIEAVIA